MIFNINHDFLLQIIDGQEKDMVDAGTMSDSVVWPPVPSYYKNTTYRYTSVACSEKNCSNIGV